MTKILVVEDEKSLSEPLAYLLRREGYDVSVVDNGPAAIDALDPSPPDLMLLDLMLPGLSGTEVCREVRARSSLPIIMLTAKNQEEDKVLGLNKGADDYLVKPFSHKELIARVKALLRRSKPSKVEDVVSFKDLTIDRLQRRVFRGNVEIDLGPTEYKLIDFFITSPTRVYSREQLLENIWTSNINVELRTVDVHIRRLRKAINLPNSKDLIRTVRSAGYALDQEKY